MTRRGLIIFVVIVSTVTDPSGLFSAGQAWGQSQEDLSTEANLPKLLRRATDFTNTLTSDELGALEADLSRFEDSTSNQLVVVLVPTVGSESIEDFALRTAELNGVGQKKRDNGVLLLIAKNDRKVRIEVGYGLEGVLPDGLAGTIIRREITPHFRSGEYYAGIKAGIDAIMLATRNEYKAEKTEPADGPVVPFIFVLFVFLLIFFVMRRARRGSNILSAVALAMLSSGSRHRGSSYSGGWKSGGGGSFGGFSGGGGSFGGGGASGSW